MVRKVLVTIFEMCVHDINTDLEIQARPHRFRKTSAIPKFKKTFFFSILTDDTFTY